MPRRFLTENGRQCAMMMMRRRLVTHNINEEASNSLSFDSGVQSRVSMRWSNNHLRHLPQPVQDAFTQNFFNTTQAKPIAKDNDMTRIPVDTIIAYEQGNQVTYSMWDYSKTNNPESVHIVVQQTIERMNKAGDEVDTVVFGSRRWAEYTSLFDISGKIIYDKKEDRDTIYFCKGGRRKGRLKIQNLPQEAAVPQ